MPGTRHWRRAGDDPAQYRRDEPVSCRAVAGSGAGRARHRANGQGRLAYRRRAARARKPQSDVPATLLARAQPDRAAMAASARQSPVPPRLSNDRGDHPQLLRGLELAARRNRPHPLPVLLSVAPTGQQLIRSVLKAENRALTDERVLLISPSRPRSGRLPVL